jgi:hypothetical protein
MQHGLREVLRRVWTSLRRRLGSVAVTTEHDAPSGARARFWAEFREGQREAEAHSSKPR